MMPKKFYWPLLIIGAFLFISVRFKAYTPERAMVGFHSDNAIYGLMAQDIQNGHFPVYFYGQNYMGPLGSLTAALVSPILHGLDIKTSVLGNEYGHFQVSPLALSIAASILVWFGALFFFNAFIIVFGPVVAALTYLLLVIGNRVLIDASLRMNGQEMGWFFGALVFYLGVLAWQKSSRKRLVILGLALGLGQWMNQTMIFCALPWLLAGMYKAEFFASIRNPMKLKDRLLFKSQAHGPKTIPNFCVFGARFFEVLAILSIFLGLVVSIIGGVDTVLWGWLKFKMLNGFSSIKTGVIILTFIHALAFLYADCELREKLINDLKKIKPLFIALLLAYSPVWAGKILKFYPKAYGISFQLIALKNIDDYWPKLYSDFFPVVFGVPISYLIILGVFLLGLLYLKRKVFKIKEFLTFNPGTYSLLTFSFAVLFFNLLFIHIAQRAYLEYAYRYGILCIPFFFAFVFYGILQIKNKLKWALIGICSLLCLYTNWQQGEATVGPIMRVDNHRERTKKLLESGYKICYADYWKAYKYEYFTQGKVQFIPYQSQDRRPDLSKIRSQMPGPHCLVTDHFDLKIKSPDSN